MATRRHWLLALQQDRESVAGVLAGVNAEPPAMAGRWCWTSASALSHTHEELRDLLLTARHPFLLFTTFDSDGWRLTAANSAGSVEEATHEFSKDWRVGNKSANQRVGKLARLIVEVATEADTTPLEDVISGRALTEVEEESDLGDLPRLFRVLGAEGILEIPQPPPPRKERAPRPTRAQNLLNGHEGRPKASIKGLSLEAAHAADLAALVLYCDPDALLALVARGSDLPVITLDVPCKIGRHDGAVMVEADGGIGLKINVVNRAAQALAVCPGLEELTIVSGRSRGGKDISWHRYWGRVRQGRWTVEEATPALEGETLAAAAALLAALRTQGPLDCESESEAETVVSRCAKSLYLPPDKGPEMQGTKLFPAEGTRFFVLMELFRLRFAKVFDTSIARKQEETEKRRWDRLEESLKENTERKGT